jgi:hypothetical protein
MDRYGRLDASLTSSALGRTPARTPYRPVWSSSSGQGTGVGASQVPPPLPATTTGGYSGAGGSAPKTRTSLLLAVPPPSTRCKHRLTTSLHLSMRARRVVVVHTRSAVACGLSGNHRPPPPPPSHAGKI